MRVTLSSADVNYNLYDLLKVADAPTVALAGAGAGNVDNGAHLYAVTFVTASGESGLGASASVTVTDKTVNGQVSITAIPIGPSGTTARKVYRTVAAGSVFKLLTTIANNTGTTATDNTADASLGANAASGDTAGLATPPAISTGDSHQAHPGIPASRLRPGDGSGHSPSRRLSLP